MKRFGIFVSLAITIVAAAATAGTAGTVRRAATTPGSGWSGDMHITAKGSYDSPTYSEKLDLQVDVTVLDDKAQFTGSFTHTSSQTLTSSKCSPPDKSDHVEGSGSGTGGGFVKSSVPAGLYDAVTGGIAFGVTHTRSYYTAHCTRQTSSKTEKFSVPIISVTRVTGNLQTDLTAAGTNTRDGCPLWIAPKQGTCTTTISWNLSRSCDTTLLRKIDRDFVQADMLFAQSESELSANSREYNKWLYGEQTEFVNVAGEKYGLIHEISRFSEGFAHFLEFDVGPVLTTYWMSNDLLPHILEHDRRLDESKRLSEQGLRIAEQGVADLKTELSQQPACKALAADERQKADLADKKRALIESWDNSGYLYWSPTRHEWETEQAALHEAGQILTGKRATQSVGHAGRRVRITLKQARAALPLVSKAVRLHRDALNRERRAVERTTKFAVKLRALLSQK